MINQYTFVFPGDTNGGRTSHVIIIKSSGHNLESPVGCINNKNHIQTRNSTKNVWVELQTEPQVTVQSVRVNKEIVMLSEVNVVLYDFKEICQSELISKKFPCAKAKDHADDVVPYFVQCVQEEEKEVAKPSTNFTVLILLVIKVFLCFIWIPEVALQNLHMVLMNRFEYSSNALQQILLRITQIKKLRGELQTGKRTILSGRLLIMIGMDIVLGVVVACVISNYVSVNDIYASFCDWTKVCDFYC